MKNNTVVLKITLTSECFCIAALSTQQLNKNWTKKSMAFKTFGSREEKDDYITFKITSIMFSNATHFQTNLATRLN